jgi:hypothetical protein
VEKYCTARQATNDNKAQAHCMLDNYGYTHTPTICNTYCFPTARGVARTRLNFIRALPVLFFHVFNHYVTIISTRHKPNGPLNFNPAWFTWITLQHILKKSLRGNSDKAFPFYRPF